MAFFGLILHIESIRANGKRSEHQLILSERASLVTEEMGDLAEILKKSQVLDLAAHSLAIKK